MKRIDIKYTAGHYTCEDCGPYESKMLTVNSDGVEVFRLYSDDHLHYNPVMDDPVEIMARTLDVLGYYVTVDRTDMDDDHD